MKLVYLPLDERPCNAIYPINTADVVDELSVAAPSQKKLGQKKRPGNVDQIREFLLEESKNADAAVISTELLAYGGLLPSRLHDSSEKIINDYETTMRTLRDDNKKLNIYVSNLIMRTPRYSSNDEEPSYYGNYGAEIFQYGWLKDKKNREKLSEEDAKEFQRLKDHIPKKYLKDYEERRAFNLRVNQLNIQLLEEGIIDFLVIPQDDAAEYGYTAMDQKKVFQLLEKYSSKDVMIYPGADEVGYTLLSRAYNELKSVKPKIYPFYSSTFGPFLTPMYEDRPFNETLKAHIMVSGCELVRSPEEADLVLAYNTPGKKMQESWMQLEDRKDVTYSSFRHLPTFINKIKNFIEEGYPIIIADSAYANGGDAELIKSLDDNQILDQIVSYKGWNTNGNTVGSTISAGVFALNNKNKEAIQRNLLTNIYEDFFYQSLVRMTVTERDLPDLNLDYFNLGNKIKDVSEIVKKEMELQEEIYLKNSFLSEDHQIKVTFPWNRMFEIYCQISMKKSNL